MKCCQDYCQKCEEHHPADATCPPLRWPWNVRLSARIRHLEELLQAERQRADTLDNQLREADQEVQHLEAQIATMIPSGRQP